MHKHVRTWQQGETNAYLQHWQPWHNQTSKPELSEAGSGRHVENAISFEEYRDKNNDQQQRKKGNSTAASGIDLSVGYAPRCPAACQSKIFYSWTIFFSQRIGECFLRFRSCWFPEHHKSFRFLQQFPSPHRQTIVHYQTTASNILITTGHACGLSDDVGYTCHWMESCHAVLRFDTDFETDGFLAIDTTWKETSSFDSLRPQKWKVCLLKCHLLIQ